MLLYVNYNIVFQEVPGEVSLAVSLSNCPNRCEGCHSPHLREKSGHPLSPAVLDEWISRYGSAITCVCFLGGDAEPQAIEKCCRHIKAQYPQDTKPLHGLKTCWYSGKETLPPDFDISVLDYLKLGPYIPALGGLASPQGNQRFYRILNHQLLDKTSLFLTRL